MRILFIHNQYQQYGGEDTVVERESALLKEHGHEVIMYTRTNDEIKAGALRKLLLPFTMVWSRKTYNDVLRLIDTYRPGIVHVHNTFFAISPSVFYACRRRCVPIVHTLYNPRLMCPAGSLYRSGGLCTRCMGLSFAWPAVVHGCYRRSRVLSLYLATMTFVHRALGTWTRIDQFLSATEFYKGLYAKGGLDHTRIFVKPHFVTPDPGARDIGPGEYFLFLGRLDPEKGVKTLMRAWAGMPDVPLVIRGSGQLAGEVRSSIRQHKMSRVEVIEGHLTTEQISKLIKQARSLIFPSEGYYETFGLVMIEAYACGVPVIASNVGVMAEVVKDKKTGLLFRPGDSGDLANKVKWAYSNPSAVSDFGKRARKEFEDRYTPARNISLLLQVYERARENLIKERSASIQDDFVTKRIGKIDFNKFTVKAALEKICSVVESATRCQQIVVANVYSLSVAHTDPAVERTFSQADFVFADGLPIVWASILLGDRIPERIAGPDFMWEFSRECAIKGYRVFLLGGRLDTLGALRQNLEMAFQGINIVGSYSPPFGTWDTKENRKIVNMINESGAEVLWLGISTPKQDMWISTHKNDLAAKVAIGVGAAFDFHSGRIKRAPLWMQKTGLEWFYRLLIEPGRLWKKYLSSNLLFFYIIMRQIAIGRDRDKRKNH